MEVDDGCFDSGYGKRLVRLSLSSASVFGNDGFGLKVDRKRENDERLRFERKRAEERRLLQPFLSFSQMAKVNKQKLV